MGTSRGTQTRKGYEKPHASEADGNTAEDVKIMIDRKSGSLSPIDLHSEIEVGADSPGIPRSRNTGASPCPFDGDPR